MKRVRIHLKTYLDRDGWLTVHASGSSFRGAMGALAQVFRKTFDDRARYRHKVLKNSRHFGGRASFPWNGTTVPLLGGTIVLYDVMSSYPAAMLKQSS